MQEFKWSHLTKLQLGRYAEYYAKMEFTRYGFAVFGAEVDDRGIDFIIRKSRKKYYEIQVKSKRGLEYIYFPKDKFLLSPDLYAVIVLFYEGKGPRLYLIPSEAWRRPNSIFKSRDYVGKKSAPEWGLELSQKNLNQLKRFSFDKTVKTL